VATHREEVVVEQGRALSLCRDEVAVDLLYPYDVNILYAYITGTCIDCTGRYTVQPRTSQSRKLPAQSALMRTSAQ
jgi:hypothetical protein